ncbi:MAG: alpha/beta hydrolase [Firmicutes bacterium]|nr:alpha/beta hydrolase [Bacillota bacterium]
MLDSNFAKRLFVRLTGFKPKVFSEEEKEQMRQKLIEGNRKQDRDIRTCPEKLIRGLSIEAVELPNASGWLVTRPENPGDRIIYYIHGGGFVGACTRDRMAFVAELVRTFGYNVFSIDYRLAPEFMYPCGLDDCLDGYQWLLERFAPEDIVLIGESAGGNFVLVLPLVLRDRGLPLPKAVYSNSPVTQMLEEKESFRRFSLKEDFIVVEGILQNTAGIYMRPEEAGDPYISPLFADLHGLPPVYLTASECECLLDDAVTMAEKLKEAGNDVRLMTYPGLCHAFIISPQMKKVVRLAYPDLGEFLHKYLG